jgi:hypothetical protein
MAFTQQETCEFIAEHTAGLARLATSADLGTISYLLSMTQIEADNQVIARRKPKKVA